MHNTCAPARYSIGFSRRWLWRFAPLLMLSFLLGCTPLEVRVLNDDVPAAETTGAGQGEPEEEGAQAAPVVEDALAMLVAYLTIFAEACGALVIGVAVVQALIRYLQFLAMRRGHERETERIRVGLGRSLAVALEFALASDILKTAVAPTWNAIAQLAAIIVLRTALNYFLEREIRHAEADERARRDGPKAGTTPA